MPSTPADHVAAAITALEAAIARQRASLGGEAVPAALALPPDFAGVEVAALLGRVGAELEAMRLGMGTAATWKATPLPYPPSPDEAAALRLHARHDPARRDTWALADLMELDDELFINGAFRAVLGREPDAQGRGYYTQALRDGSLSKLAVLALLRRSDEGRNAARPVAGLDRALRSVRFAALPVIGPVFAIMESLLRLPSLELAVERGRTTHYRYANEITANFDRLAHVLRAALSVLWAATERINALQLADHERRQNVRGLLQQISALRDSVEHAGGTEVPEAAGQALRALQASLAAQAARLEATGADIGNAGRQIADLTSGLHGLAAETRGTLKGVGDALSNAGTQIADLTRGLHELAAETHDTFKGVSVDLGNAGSQITDLTRGLHELAAENRGHAEEVAAALGNAGSQIADLTSGLHSFAAEARGKLAGLNEAILGEQRRIARMLDDLAAAPAGTVRAKSVARHEEHLFDAVYAEFERRYRGERAAIKERVAYYLPLVRAAATVTKKTPLLDVGSGRGEWLEVLHEQGIPARGIDLSDIFVAECRALGLEAEEAEAIAYLRAAKDTSLGAVTALHVVEHLSFRQLVALFDESFRALKPGGLLVFETPNPENLIVGACNFWLDPSHVKPLPPETLRFLAETRGFTAVEVHRLHPYPADQALPEGAVPAKVNELLYGPRDYAVVARRPAK